MAFPGAKVGYPGTITALDPVTASNNNKFPGGRLLYESGNDSETGISTNDGVNGCVGSCTIGTSRVIKVTGKVGQISKHGRGMTKLVLLVDSVQTAVLWRQIMGDNDAGTPEVASIASAQGEYIATYTAGSHAFQIAMQCTSGTLDIDATGDAPENFILVEDIGPI